jgi:uncharacterized membrane protein YhaH (DUF805 family)
MNQAMTPVDWAKRPITEKYADFSGRAPRAELWWYVLGLLIVYIFLTIIESIIGINRMVFGLYGPLVCLLWLGTIVPSIAVGVRRLHDTNRSGWWLLLPLVPWALAIAFGGTAMLGAAAGSGMGLMAGAGIAFIFMSLCLVAEVVILIFYVLPGTPGDNRYGPNPYGGGAGGTVAAE